MHAPPSRGGPKLACMWEMYSTPADQGSRRPTGTRRHCFGVSRTRVDIPISNVTYIHIPLARVSSLPHLLISCLSILYHLYDSKPRSSAILHPHIDCIFTSRRHKEFTKADQCIDRWVSSATSRPFVASCPTWIDSGEYSSEVNDKC
jgi:hypothetical protein